MQDTRGRLGRILSQVLEIADDDAVLASMDTVPQWDSMAHINIVLSVEQEFRISFTPEEAAANTSFAQLEQLIEQKRS